MDRNFNFATTTLHHTAHTKQEELMAEFELRLAG
jgi:hypothetical protein